MNETTLAKVKTFLDNPESLTPPQLYDLVEEVYNKLLSIKE